MPRGAGLWLGLGHSGVKGSTAVNTFLYGRYIFRRGISSPGFAISSAGLVVTRLVTGVAFRSTRTLAGPGEAMNVSGTREVIEELIAALERCARPELVNPGTDLWFSMTSARFLLARLEAQGEQHRGEAVPQQAGLD